MLKAINHHHFVILSPSPLTPTPLKRECHLEKEKGDQIDLLGHHNEAAQEEVGFLNGPGL